MLTATTILDNFERLGWKDNNDPMGQMFRLWQQDPTLLGELVTEFLNRSLKSYTFIDAALELMDDDTYISTVNHAWKLAALGCDSPALPDVLDSAALQYPQVFADDWERLLIAVASKLGGPRYMSDVAWRALDPVTAKDWMDQLSLSAINESLGYERAVALLYSRQRDIVLNTWRSIFCEQAKLSEQEWRLMSAGYELNGDTLRELHSDSPLHIDLSLEQRKHILAGLPEWQRNNRISHPSWQSDTNTITVGHMGGLLPHTCGLCYAPLQGLLSLKQPKLAGIASNTAIEFGTCLSCLGWESDGAMFYRHDAQGKPYSHPIQQSDVVQTPQFSQANLLEAEVNIYRASHRWAYQDWGTSNDRQNLHRVGGAPSWIQGAEYPDCPDCHRRMYFVMQLDSGLPLADGNEWLWGSGGCNYTFWCEDCRVSAHLWQCT